MIQLQMFSSHRTFAGTQRAAVPGKSYRRKPSVQRQLLQEIQPGQHPFFIIISLPDSFLPDTLAKRHRGGSDLSIEIHHLLLAVECKVL